jgi:O-antigen/teichoic acid export membrane protein
VTVTTVDLLDSPESTQKVIRGGFVRTAAYLASVLAGVAALPFLFRHLGVVDSGRYTTVITIVTMVGSLAETGLAPVSVREYSRAGPEDRRELMAMLVGLRLTVVGVAALGALAFMIVAGYSPVLVAGAAVALVGALCESASSAYGAWMSANLRLGWLAGMQFARQIIAVVLTVALVIAGAPLFYFFALLLLAGIGQLVVSVIPTRGQIPYRPAFQRAPFVTFLRRSAPYLLAMALGVVYFRIAMVLMSVLSTDDQTGYFGVPFRLLELVTLVSVLLMSSAFPILARTAGRDRRRHRYALLRLSEAAVIAGGLVALAALTGAGVIVHVLGGPDFDPSAPVLRILAISLAAKFVIAAWAFALLSLEEYRGVLRANSVAIVLAALLAVVLVPAFDARGAAIATAIADVVLVVGYGIALVRSHSDVRLPVRTAAVVASAVAAAGLAAFLAPVGAVGRVVLAMLVYLAVLVLARAIPDEVAAAVPGGRLLRVGARRSGHTCD